MEGRTIPTGMGADSDRQAAVLIETLDDPEGAMILRSPRRLGSYPDRLGDYLVRWANESPDRAFLAARAADDTWQILTFGEALKAAESVGQALLDLGLTPERPVMLLSENSIDHAIVQMAAMHVGIPAAPVSPAYSLVSHDHAKLRHIFDLVRPGLIYVSNEDRFAGALASLDVNGVELVSSDDHPVRGASLAELMETKPGAGVGEAFSRVGRDTVAKILFTSGSTDLPKGVINTHGMLCSNQQMMVQLWPVLEAHPPILVDWLPWNHTFGGNHNFNIVLRNGGTLYIDDGKPVPGAFERTLQNLREVSPTVYFNVPKGFTVLVPRLEADRDLAAAFFRRLDMVFSAAAALPQPLYDRIVRLSQEVTGEAVTMGSGWGATETSPLITGVGSGNATASSIGLPAPGVDLKMVPNGRTFELRVRGPNVTPGYFRNEELTRAAFDEEGFYKIGDAGKFIDPEDPSQGLAFDGRITEDFKLSTGTWVQVGKLRIAVLEATSPLLQDLVVCGHNRDYLAILAWPDVERCCEVAGAAPDEDLSVLIRSAEVLNRLREGLRDYNARNKGSSTRVERILLMTEPPDMDANEITDKGYVNQRATLENRSDLVARLFADPPDPDVIVV